MLCKSCLQDKEPSAFYASNRTKCKECVKEAVRTNRLENIEHYRAFDRMRASMPHRVAARKEYQATEAGMVAASAAKKRWDAANHVKKLAAGKVAKAIRAGKLIRWPVCEIPGCTAKPEAHHADYSLPLDVTWLCDHHHKETHKLARELQQQFKLKGD